MRTSQFPLNTLKEIPNDAEIISHQLMLRAGFIRRVSTGLYSWTPMGLRTLRKVENIIREEMNKAGALEMLMPSVQPSELWEESGRWGKFGPELLRFKDRHQRDYCLGPTHEEVITDFVRREVKSYKQLPLNFYQIQWKFRDEVRPRFGVMRSREFLMKDAYSFHLNETSLIETYEKMYQAYSAIFTRLSLKFRAVTADSGAIGGNRSQEFHVLADSGEDAIVFATDSEYAANIEMAPACTVGKRQAPCENKAKIATPKAHTIKDVATFLKINAEKILKSLVVKNNDNELIMLCLRGDHELNEVKVSKLAGLSNFSFASDAEIAEQFKAKAGSLGPCEANIRVIYDLSAAEMSNFICGANESDFHFTGVNFERDLIIKETADLRNVVEGDQAPDGKGSLKIARGIEVGHIFQLGNQYSKAMNAVVLNETGQNQAFEMGCYGIGVTRVVAAAIEQNNDAAGIIWSEAMAPFTVSLIPMNMAKSELVRNTTLELYQNLLDLGIEVLFEDRDIRPGNAFSDHELVGIPHCLVIGERSLANGKIEYKARKDSESQELELKDAIHFIAEKLAIKI